MHTGCHNNNYYDNVYIPAIFHPNCSARDAIIMIMKFAIIFGPLARKINYILEIHVIIIYYKLGSPPYRMF